MDKMPGRYAPLSERTTARYERKSFQTFAVDEKTFLGRNCELPEKRQLFSMQER